MVPYRIQRLIDLILHSGNTYKCPFCNYSSKHLAPIGVHSTVLEKYKVIGGGARKGGCYKCGSVDRVRLIYTYLQYEIDFFNKFKKKKILHIAPEKHISDFFLKNNFSEYICGDLFTEGYSYPDYVINLNILNLSFQDNHFDFIICNHVLEHIPNDISAMEELYRVLNKGGTGILQVPISKIITQTLEDFSITDPKDREQIFGQYDHVRIYGSDYKKRLESVGFKVDLINISAKYKEFGLLPDEDIYLVKK